MAGSGIYETMEFPTYEFREFPKMLIMPDGREVIAKDEREALVLIADSGASTGKPDPVLEQRNELLVQVEALKAELAAAKAGQTPDAPKPASPIADKLKT